jgi:hypothetical protein
VFSPNNSTRTSFAKCRQRLLSVANQLPSSDDAAAIQSVLLPATHVSGMPPHQAYPVSNVRTYSSIHDVGNSDEDSHEDQF